MSVAGAAGGMVQERPGIHLVIGPPNAGKLGWVIRWWAACRDREPLVVVPTAPDVPLTTLELVERAGPVVGSKPVVTFDGLAAEVRDLGGHLPRVADTLGDVERRFVLEQALRRLPEGRLRALAHRPGGVEVLGEIVSELDESGFGADVILAGLQAWAESDGGERAHDLALFYREFRALLAREGRCERVDVVRDAYTSTVGWLRPVACYGFVSFTPAQRGLLRRLCQESPVVISLVDDPGRRWATYFAAEVIQWTGEARSLERLDRQRLAYSSPQVAALEGSFLRVDPPPIPAAPQGDAPAGACQGSQVGSEAGADDGSGTSGDGGGASYAQQGVRFLLASGRRAEAELVAREVAALVRDGFPPGQVGILARETGSWHRLLSRVLQAYGVPHRIDAEVTFAETGLGAALMAGLNGVATADLESLLAYLRSPYCTAAVCDVDRLELMLRDTRDVEGHAMVQAVAESLPDALAPVRDCLPPDTKRGTAVDVAAVRRLLAGMLSAAARDRTLWSPEFEADTAAFRAGTGALEQVGRAAAAGWMADGVGLPGAPAGADPGADDRDTLHLPSEHVLSSLRDAPVRTGPRLRQDVVHVMSIPRARARRFQAVYVVGLTDGEFPRPERPPALLTAQQRAAANRAAGRALFSQPPSGEELGLFALALSRAWQLVGLSARDAEDDGDPATPSPYWTEARRCLGVVESAERRTLSEVVHPIERAPSMREYLRACAATGVLPAGSGSVCIEEAWRSWDCRPGRLGPASRDLLSARRVFSVTEIEQYARCPFAWFIGNLVGLDEMEESFDGRVLGSILHRSLRDLYLALREEGLLPLRALGLSRARALTPVIVDAAAATLAPPGLPGELRLARWQVEERVINAVEADAAAAGILTPTAFESPLPREGVDIGGVMISGRIDRVDGGRGDEPVFVIDYKSGNGGSAPAFGSREAVQVPLYLLGLRGLDPQRGLAGGAYLYVGGPVSKGAVVEDHAEVVGARVPAKSRLSAEAFEALLEGARVVATHAVAGMQAGSIPAEPPGGCPRYCDLGGLCRQGGGPSRW